MDPKRPTGVLDPGWLQEWNEFWELIAAITGGASGQASSWTYQIGRCPEQPDGNSWDCGPMCLAIILAVLSGAHPNQLYYTNWVQCEAMGVMRNELANSYRTYSLSEAVLQRSRFKESWRIAVTSVPVPSLGQQGPTSMKSTAGVNGAAPLLTASTSATVASSSAGRMAGAQNAGAWGRPWTAAGPTATAAAVKQQQARGTPASAAVTAVATAPASTVSGAGGASAATPSTGFSYSPTAPWLASTQLSTEVARAAETAAWTAVAAAGSGAVKPTRTRHNCDTIPSFSDGTR
jgi:hypothetical protein